MGARRWRPVIFVAVVMFGELVAFLTIAAMVKRPRPDVPRLDSNLPTSRVPVRAHGRDHVPVGEHHPTDILGSLVFAALWLTAATMLVKPSKDGLDRAGRLLRQEGAGRSRETASAYPVPVSAGEQRRTG